MATQKHMGRNELIERLTAQVGNKETAIELLKNRGHLTKDGKYTAEGKPKSAFKYNPKTNMAKLKG